MTGRVDDAYTYLSKFSRLLRLVLEHSDTTMVSLQSEMEILHLYISLEQLRFKGDMLYDVQLDPDLDGEEIRIPPMLIQPHLENAIWHGLRNKGGDKKLQLSITEKNAGYLNIVVEDNGIGRVKAAELKTQQIRTKQHESKGSILSENRMALLKKNFPLTSMTITDLYHEDGVAAGTKVELVIPVLNGK